MDSFNLTKWQWRAVVINPTWAFPKMSLRQKAAQLYGWDIFFGKVPILKTTVLANTLITVALVEVLS